MPTLLMVGVQLFMVVIAGLVITALIIGIKCMLKYLREHKDSFFK